ncbi:MAG: STAS domain-containing protein [Spirochaetia bacterium]|nr:STAS domain-containing protein [Spirochaetia bacterium]
MAQFDYKQVSQGGVITINGRFTIQDKDLFSNLVKEKVDLAKSNLYIDAGGLIYIDSSAIGDLLKLKMEASKHSKKVHIAGLSDSVLKIFKMACLDSVFVVIDSDDFAKIANG